MAGDWIKMRSNLWDDPRVSSLCDQTGESEASIVGGLYWLWATADQHSVDGILPGMSAKSIDRKTGIAGLGDALSTIGWIAEHPEGLRIVRFDEHNGKSAKRRCSESVRKMSARHADNPQQDGAPRGRGRGREEGLTDPPLESSKVDCPTPTAPAPKKEGSQGKRLAEDWLLPKAWGEWALSENKALTPDDVRKEAEKFKDFWLAKAGKDARKVDWLATWRSWIRSDFIKPSGTAPPGSSTTWYLSGSGIEAKAVELGIVQAVGEVFPVFKGRVFAAAGVTDDMLRTAQQDAPRHAR